MWSTFLLFSSNSLEIYSLDPFHAAEAPDRALERLRKIVARLSRPAIKPFLSVVKLFAYPYQLEGGVVTSVFVLLFLCDHRAMHGAA